MLEKKNKEKKCLLIVLQRKIEVQRKELKEKQKNKHIDRNSLLVMGRTSCSL